MSRLLTLTIFALIMMPGWLGSAAIAEITPDGAQWTQATSEAPWGKRDSFALLSYGGKIWLFGGIVDGHYENDVWTTTDGAEWTQVVTSGAVWTPRALHQALVFDGKMWILGGEAQGGNANDVWSSTDGIHWTQQTAAAQWLARQNFMATVFAGKMWVMGGYSSIGFSNDVWSSSDGVTWTAMTPTGTMWSSRGGATLVVNQDKMWLMGGVPIAGTFYINQVWSTPDGLTWTQETLDEPSWIGRYRHSSIVWDGKIWVFGGQGVGDVYFNDVWQSANGTTWTEVTSDAGWPVRHQQAAVVFDQKVWIMGGNTVYPTSEIVERLSDVWYTPLSAVQRDAVAPLWMDYE